MREAWITIKDAPGYEINEAGKIRNSKTGRILKPHLNRPGGYERVNLNGKHRYVHRLLVENVYEYELDKEEYVRFRSKNKRNIDLNNMKIAHKNN